MTMTGKREVKNVTINPEVVDPEEVEDLQDLIMACMNDILTQIEEANNEAVNSMTGGMNFGGLNF
ncbi:MAG: YbaB/EbfC family nucleoid-associated protein [Lachnospiraceae bacterium]|nr:YbaB/EbfC family nucleoid-associated protein [Lachnospiraceae bacterium]